MEKFVLDERMFTWESVEPLGNDILLTIGVCIRTEVDIGLL
jgi:hypothetical protein